MTIMKIEVFPDTSQPTGGHAVIRLKGIALLPPGTTFRIDPIDDTLDDGDFDGWPRGNLSPLDTRQTPEGIEMRIGPDIVDAPLLEPGTPVTISVPDSKLSAELIWPDLPLSSSLRQAPVVMSPSQMAAELAATERARTEAANAARAAKEAELAAATRAEKARVEAARFEAARFEAERLAKKPPTKPVAVPAAAAPTQQQRLAAAARELQAALALEPQDTKPGTLAKALDSMPPANKAADDALANLASANIGGDRPRSNNHGSATLSSLSKSTSDRLESTLTATPDRDHSLPTIILKRSDAPGNPPSTIETSKLRRETIDGRLAPQSTPSRIMPFLAGAGAAAIALAALLAVTSLRSGSNSPPPISGVQMAAAQKSGLADAFTVGTQSPRGEIATDVDLPTALRLADYNLHGVDRPIDRAEAEFWLKKAMSLTASHSQIRWAMTQLGTLSAEPVTGTPDYEKARLLWEISAANGDPVAMCFLGTLLEHGLGLSADRTKALEHFKRARGAGGCPNSDEAIARLSK